jgi:hypothetical protein
MFNLFRFSIVLSLAHFGCYSIRAQQAHSDCGTMEYEHRNQSDYGPLRVTSVRGTVKVLDGLPAYRACVGVFTESNQKLLTATKADDEGGFQITGLPNGTYRLVVTAEGLCAANVVIVLKNKPRRKKKLAVVMKPSDIDVCSYIELE